MSQNTFELTLDKVVSGKADPIRLGFCITDIGSKDEPEFDNYLYSIQLLDMVEPDLREYLELKAENKKFTGDVTWKIEHPIEGNKPDLEDEEERTIVRYKIHNVVLKTFKNGKPMAKASITFPFEAVVATDNWKD